MLSADVTGVGINLVILDCKSIVADNVKFWHDVDELVLTWVWLGLRVILVCKSIVVMLSFGMM